MYRLRPAVSTDVIRLEQPPPTIDQGEVVEVASTDEHNTSH